MTPKRTELESPSWSEFEEYVHNFEARATGTFYSLICLEAVCSQTFMQLLFRHSYHCLFAMQLHVLCDFINCIASHLYLHIARS